MSGRIGRTLVVPKKEASKPRRISLQSLKEGIKESVESLKEGVKESVEGLKEKVAGKSKSTT